MRIIILALVLWCSVAQAARPAKVTTKSVDKIARVQTVVEQANKIIIGRIESKPRMMNASGSEWVNVAVLEVLKGTVTTTNLRVLVHFYSFERDRNYLLCLNARGWADGELAVVEVPYWPFQPEEWADKSVEQKIISILNTRRGQLSQQLARIGGEHAALSDTIELYEAERRKDTNALRVVVLPVQHFVRVNEPFKVKLQVENRTANSQSMRLMNCSWDEHWKSSNTNVSWESWDCAKNFADAVAIAPGRAFIKELKMIVLAAPPPNAKQPQLNDWLTFRMGFTPIESPKTFWSQEVALKVIP